MKFKLDDKVVLNSNDTRVGTITSIEHSGVFASQGRPYSVDFGVIYDGVKYTSWFGPDDLQLYKKKFIRFKMEVDDFQRMQGLVKIPWYMGRSYSDVCMSIYYYHMMPFNYILRYMRYFYYFWFSFTKGPEHFVIMDRQTYHETLRSEYERGREKSDEYFKQEVQQASYRRNR
jgi:hypothetical protein